MSNSISRAMFVTTLLFLFSVTNAWCGLTYNGSSTIGMGIMPNATKEFAKKTGIHFESVSNEGTGKGLKALAEGKVSLAGASRHLKPEELEQGLVPTAIGYDAIAVFVHVSNPVNSLTKEQLKGIFTGRITNWKQVGGKNAPIVPNTELLDGKRATIEMFQELVMDKEPYGKGFKQIDFPRDQISEVAREKNGIATVSRGLISSIPPIWRSQVKAIRVNDFAPSPANIRNGTYPISRSLYLVTKGKPTGLARKFISFMLSEEGQFIVRENFVSIR